MNIERISVCNKTKAITNDNISRVSEMNYAKQNSNDLFIKANRNLSFGKNSGTGAVAGFGIGTIAGLVAASVLTGGAATLPFLSAMGLGVLGSAAVGAGAATGAIVGDKIEDMTKGGKK